MRNQPISIKCLRCGFGYAWWSLELTRHEEQTELDIVNLRWACSTSLTCLHEDCDYSATAMGENERLATGRVIAAYLEDNDDG